MIYQVEMLNFKQHKNFTATFETGLNTLQGENGAGKTTVLKAILFSLFGAAAAGAKEHLTSWGETKMLVSTTLLLGNLGEVVIRRGGTKAELWQEDTLLASGQSPVTKMVEEHLGMDAKLFKSMLYAGQGETQLLLKMGATGLQKQLELVANTDVLDRVIAKINTDNLVHEGELMGIGYVEDVNNLRTDFDSLNQDIKTNETQLTLDTALLKQSTLSLDEAKASYSAAVNNNLLQSQLTSQLAHQEGRTLLLVDQEAAHRVTRPRPVTVGLVEQLSEEAKTLSQELLNDEQMVREYKDGVARYQSVSQKYEELKPYEPILSEAHRFIEEASALKRLMDDLNTAYHAKKKEQADSVCAACARPFNEQTLAALAKEVDDLATLVSVSTGEWSYAAGLRDEFLRTYKLTESTLPTIEASLVYTKTALQDTPVPAPLPVCDIADKQAKLAGYQAKLREINQTLLDTNAWNTKDQQLQKALEESKQLELPLRAKLAEVAVLDREELLQLETETTRLQAIVAELNVRVNTATQQLQSNQRAAESLQTRIAQCEVQTDRINRIEKEMALRSELQKYLRRNRAKFMEDTWESLTHYASHLLDSVTEGLIHSLSRSDAGDFYVIEGGQSAPVEELSGARKSIVGLCLRLSLTHLFYGTKGFTLLDEVTADCSEYNAARVAGMLKGLQSQVIMVTHRQSDAMNANHSIYLN